MIVWIEHDPESGFSISRKRTIGSQRIHIPRKELILIEGAFDAFDEAHRKLSVYWDEKKARRNSTRRYRRDVKRNP